MLKPPVEGNRSVPISILWVRDGVAPGNTVEFNAQAQRVTPISQIAALYIDNSQNAANVAVIFPDTNFMITAPANSLGYYPVISNGVRFYAFIELLPTAQERTIIQVLNFLPPALAIASGPAQGISLAVTEVDTLSPIVGGPITGQGTISLDPNALLANVIQTYPAINLSGTLSAGAASFASLAVSGAAIHGTVAGPSPGPGAIAMRAPLIVNETTRAPQQIPAGTQRMVHLLGPTTGAGTIPIVLFDGVGTNGTPTFILRYARETAGNLSAVQSGDGLGSYAFRGFGATVYSLGAVRLAARATENWTDSAQGAALDFYTTQNTTIGQTLNMTLDGFGTLQIFGSQASNAIKPGGGSWAAPSDPRLKDDVEPFEAGLDEVLALEPVEYSYNGKGGLRASGTRYVGLDAKHAQDVMPSLVGTMEHDGEEYLTVDPSALVYALLNAVKELEAKVRRLERASPVGDTHRAGGNAHPEPRPRPRK